MSYIVCQLEPGLLKLGSGPASLPQSSKGLKKSKKKKTLPVSSNGKENHDQVIIELGFDLIDNGVHPHVQYEFLIS